MNQYNSTFRQILEQQKYRALLLTLFFPILGIIYALIHWRETWAKNTFWLGCIYMGFIQIFHVEGTILGEGIDAGRYVLQMQYMYQFAQNFSDISVNFFDGETNDIFGPILQYLVSRFTDNGHIFLGCIAIIFGYFYSRDIWYVLDHLPHTISKSSKIIIAALFLTCPIWLINGFRMWTAVLVFIYGVAPFLLEGKKKKLIWCYLTILIHSSFIVPILILTFYLVLKIVIPSKWSQGNALLICCFSFYLTTLVLHTLDLEKINSSLNDLLPNYYSKRIDSYVSTERSELKQDLMNELSWHVAFFTNLKYWCIQILLVLSTIYIYRHDKLKKLYPYLLFTLLFYGFTNILSNIPSGSRFYVAADTFALSIILLSTNYADDKKSVTYQRIWKICCIVLLFSLIFKVREGLDLYGITLIFGNFFTLPFVEINVPIIDYIKSFL